MIEFIRKHLFFVIFILILIIAIASVQQKISRIDKEVKTEMKQTQQEVYVCRQVLNNNNYDEAVSCFSNLVDKYENIEFRYYLGIALKYKKRYGEALEQFKYIVSKEIDDKKLIYDAENQIKEINNILIRINTAKRFDTGHYYAKLNETAVWKNPKHINVYISDNYNKKKLFKKAFKEWDDSLYGMLDFYYTDDEDKADITATAIDLKGLRNLKTQTSTEKSIGATLYQTYYYNINKNKLFLEKAEIYVSYNDDYGNKRDDNDFLSIALHEIGHSIGILSHSPRYGDIMYPDDSGLAHEYSKLSNRDINTVRRIYGNI